MSFLERVHTRLLLGEFRNPWLLLANPQQASQSLERHADAVKTSLLLALLFTGLAPVHAIDAAKPAATPAPPCCREGLPLRKYSETSVYTLDSVWTSDVGRQVKLDAFRGYPQVLALFFTNCQYSCPLIVADMKAVEKALPRAVRDKVDFLLVSIDPKRDTPEVLHNYRVQRQLGTEHWTLLHGSPEAVKRLAEKVGFQYSPGSDRQFGHTLVITILDQNGEIVFQQPGVGAFPDAAVDTLVRLTKRDTKNKR